MVEACFQIGTRVFETRSRFWVAYVGDVVVCRLWQIAGAESDWSRWVKLLEGDIHLRVSLLKRLCLNDIEREAPFTVIQ